jgi:peptidoglycan/xylan/chitin deacetylase (PgdA/CDA1 family)
MRRWSLASRRAFLALAGAGLAAAVAACRGQPQQHDQGAAAGSRPATPASTIPRASRAPSSTVPPAAGPARVVFHGPRDGRQVALTFHGSGDPALVARLLDEVARERVPIAVFVVGQWLERHPEMAARILGGGHELDNHTYTHPQLGRLGRAGVDQEVRRCRAVLERLAGGGRYFRPSGMTTPTPLVLAAAGAAGYPLVVSFDVDPRDYADPGATAVAARVAAGLAPGAIVSLHTGHAGTVAALPHIVAAVRARGLEPVPLHQLLEHEKRRSSGG